MASIFGDLSAAEFLRDYWQKRPLLIRQAFPEFRSPIRPEELAGLACEDDVESRLILEEGGEYPWELRYGPFDEEDFRTLPSSRWTLLVQEVDRLVPEVGALLDRFRFVPDWRIDDVMVSYAPDGGGVGPHIDNYDVFLLQAMGRRKWQIGRQRVDRPNLIPDLDVSVLADFQADDEWVLEPGDMLYLPPRIPHNGVAVGDSMTFSIGFRAPSDAELVTGFLSSVGDDIDPDLRYEDADLEEAPSPGEIDVRALEYVRRAIRRALENEQAVDRWFGRYVTEARRGFVPAMPGEEVTPDQVREGIESGAVIQRAPGVRMAYFRREDGRTGFFVGGEEYEFDADLANLASVLANRRSFRALELQDVANEAVYDLLAELINEGYLTIAVDGPGV